MPARGEGMCEVKEEKETENCSMLSPIGKYEPNRCGKQTRERESERRVKQIED